MWPAPSSKCGMRLELDPGRPELHDELGTLLVRQTSMNCGDPAPRAKRTYLPRTDTDPANAASDTASAPPPQDAENEFAEALRLQPELAAAHLHLGVLKFQEKALDDAIPHLQDAVRLDPQKRASTFLSGAGAAPERRPGRRPGEVLVAVKLQPDLLDAQNLLGLRSNDLGNADEAVAAFREVVKAQPENADAHNNLGLALLQLG